MDLTDVFNIRLSYEGSIVINIFSLIQILLHYMGIKQELWICYIGTTNFPQEVQAIQTKLSKDSF